MATVFNTGTEGLGGLIDSLSSLRSAGPDDPGVGRTATLIALGANNSPGPSGPVFTGTGFTFDAAGRPTGGTVIGFDAPGFKTILGYGITGIQVPLTTLYAAAVQGRGNALVPELLSGNDTFEASTVSPATLSGYGGDDLFRFLSGRSVDGGAGVDTVESGGLRSDTTVEVRPGSLLMTLPMASTSATYTSVETIRFADGTLSFDPATAGGQVYIFFQTALGRAPGAGELGYFTDAASRYGLPAVASGLLATPEGQARLGGLGDAGFIDAVYRAALGRGADPGGSQFWQGRLAAGDAGRGAVLAGIAATDEAKGRASAAIAPGIFGVDPDAVGVTRVYLAATGAPPSAASLAYDATQPLYGLEKSLANNGLSDADFVASLIRNAYGAGASDPGAVAYYTQILSGAGTPAALLDARAAVLDAYAFSPGIDARVAPYVTDRGLLLA